MNTFGKIGNEVTVDYTITNNVTTNSGKIKLSNALGSYFFSTDRITLTKKNKNKNNKWEFTTTIDHDIDYALLSAELTKQTPLMLITIGKEKIVGVHFSIVYKNNYCETHMPSRKFINNHFAKINGEFSEWVEWAKAVKNAKWPPNMVNKRKVKVALPII